MLIILTIDIALSKFDFILYKSSNQPLFNDSNTSSILCILALRQLYKSLDFCRQIYATNLTAY